MKNQSILLILLALLFLPSCMVTRSRYGNGIHIEMPEVFKKDRNQLTKKSQLLSQKNKKSQHLSKETPDSPIVAKTNEIDTSNQSIVLTQHLPSSNFVEHSSSYGKMNKTTALKNSLFKEKQSANINNKQTHSNTSKQISMLSDSGKNFFDGVTKLIVQLFLAMIIGTIIALLIIYLVPPIVIIWFIIGINVIYYLCKLVEVLSK